MSTIVLPNEKELLIRVANGCEESYKHLFTWYWNKIYAVAFQFTKSREMSQDLTQDIFARIWARRDRLADVKQFDSYLFIVARNLILDRLREKSSDPAYHIQLADYFSDASPLPSRRVELKEMEAIIHAGVHRLPGQQRLAFYLSRYQGLRQEEIALQMGITKQSVKSHLVRALSSLRKYLLARTMSLLCLVVWIVS